MIFVIVAILILIVSFVIALASLIKEQSKQTASSGRKTLANRYSQEATTTSSQSADLSKQKEQASADHELSHVAEDQGLEREPFIWEQGQEQVTEQDQASEQPIAEVERKLAAYKLQKQQKVASENEDTSTKEARKGQNLSGEFLLSDLK